VSEQKTPRRIKYLSKSCQRQKEMGTDGASRDMNLTKKQHFIGK